MENKLITITPDVTFQSGVVKFDNFEAYKARANEIAAFVSSVQVTPDTVKASKKMIAETRKIVDELNKRKVTIKKELLKDYVDFEDQIKELQGIIDSADKTIRDQVRTIEEMERAEKELKLREIWAKRIGQYDLDDIPNLFGRWLTPQMLNKSASLKKAEDNMVFFLEKTQTDIETILKMDDHDEIMKGYLEYFSLQEAITFAQYQKDKAEQAAKLAATIDPSPEMAATFVVRGEKDIKLAEMLLKENGINFKKI